VGVRVGADPPARRSSGLAGLAEPIEASGGSPRGPPVTARIRRCHTTATLLAVRAHRGTEISKSSLLQRGDSIETCYRRRSYAAIDVARLKGFVPETPGGSWMGYSANRGLSPAPDRKNAKIPPTRSLAGFILISPTSTSGKSASIQSSSARCASAFSSFTAGGGAPSLERRFDASVQRLRCLPWEAETGLRWAQLLASLRTAGRAMPIKTALSPPPLSSTTCHAQPRRF